MQFGIEGNVALQQVLATMDLERKKIASTQIKGYIFILLGIAIAVICFILGFPIPAVIGGLIPFIYGAVLHYKIGDDLRAYKNAYKRDVIGAALKFLDESLALQPGAGIDASEFVYTQLFTQKPDRYNTEDLVTGSAGKTRFYFAEVHAEYKTVTQTKNGTRTEWHDIFRGIIFAADFNKNFNGITIVRPKGFANALGAWFSKNIFSFGDSDVVKLENPDFDKTFVTYGSDQVEARYILTPAMMDRILTLNRESKYEITLSFIESRMYIAFPLNRNYFEPPVFKSLINAETLNDDITAVKFMYDIVQELDLNTRIWGKA
ncbi:DUF3137 domain-containing protein [Pedobacter sp. HDW13]|uniref:DUF3137 domain-containing protein n=1 Tax=unclassified Pedobacter TaxID=2628915 RepID=UPI000F58FF43|nr:MULTISPECIES: DUF3137 domain-containing protein [unclassified Pedobacter]QIL39579.1 DUF3137 domain-containing protein [Pedobacter sp. HDW13]RQO78536.1 galanin [Pedobacter sp. KBW01]